MNDPRGRVVGDERALLAALTSAPLEDRVRRLEARLARERRARADAERLLETKSLELYDANRALSALAADLEKRVEERTRELFHERQLALETAEIDALTGIANRASFSRQLDELLLRGRETGEGIAALLIDLDDFKSVNDTLGHAAGDALLIEFAHRLVETVRPGDVVARIGGDEFAVISRAVGAKVGPMAMAHRLLRALCQPVAINGRSVACSCSIGVAEPSGDAQGADHLLRDADLALYAAKRAGRARVTSFEASLRADIERRAALDAEIREAVIADQIEPWYQPIFSTETQSHAGVEVLARWHRPNGEISAPAVFLEAVEELGLLDLMMENMLRRAFAETAPAVSVGALSSVSINVSPEQFNRGWTLSHLPALLEETGFPADALTVEITETALLNDIAHAKAALEALKSAGIRIALDDFGVGYSNFSLLRQLPVDILKLDRSLVCDIEVDDHALALAQCLLDLSARLAIKVVAEGIETERQAEILADAGCTSMQGYWFARPQRRLATWFGAR